MSRFSGPLRYSGAKSLAVDAILSKFPKGQIDRYFEPFAGNYTIGLAAISKGLNILNYFLNDWDRGVYAVHYCIKYMPDAFKEKLRLIKMIADNGLARTYFDMYKTDLKSDNSPELLELATWFFYVNRCSFNGAGIYGGFSKSSASDRFTYSSIDKIGKLAPLYKDINITDWDYVDVLKTHATCKSPNNTYFMYVDSPYDLGPVKSNLYKGHKEFDHELLAARLNQFKSDYKFLISYNDCDNIREYYKDWIIEPLEIPYSMGKEKKGKELLIRNYEDI